LLIAEWNQTATFGHNNAGFLACGNCPSDPQRIHDHALSISNRAADESNSTAAVEATVNITKTREVFQHSSHRSGVCCIFQHNSAAARNTPFNIPAQLCCSQHTFPVPLVQRPKPPGRKKQSDQLLTSAELRLTIVTGQLLQG
jgi:hypothetical protein